MSLDRYLYKPTGKMPPKQLSRKKDSPVASPENEVAMLAANSDAAPDPALTKALEAMTANISTMMDEKLDKMLQNITSNISHSLKEINDRVGEAEQRISSVEDASLSADQRLLALEKTTKELREQLQDFENRGRRKNLRIIGLQEKLEGANPTQFMETWIPKLLQLDTKAGRVKLERAHRLPGPQTPRLPRAMIVRFHHFSDRQRVMDAARRLKDIRLDGARIHFFPDFTAATQKRRREYDQVRKRLQNIEGARYAMMYPASLRITVNDTVKIFHSPEEASAFVDSL